VGKSLLVANLALALAAGSDRLGFPIATPCRFLVCQFELPVPQFVSSFPMRFQLRMAHTSQRRLVVAACHRTLG